MIDFTALFSLSSRKKDAIALLVVGFLAVIFFWKFLFLGHIPLNADWLLSNFEPWRQAYRNLPVQNAELDDPILLHYPLWQAARRMMREGALPLWNPYIFCGSPLLADSMCHPFDPLNLLTLFLPDMTAWGLILFLSFLLAGVTFYLYLREVGLGQIGAFVGAACYMLNGFVVVWAEYRFVAGLFCWLPVSLIAVERLAKAKSMVWALLGGVALGFQILAGNLHFVLLAGAFLILYMVWKIRCVAYARGAPAALRLLKALGLMVGVGAGLSAVQWLPTWELAAQSQRDLEKYSGINFLSPLELITLVAPKFFGHPGDGSFVGSHLFPRSYVTMNTPYVSILGLMLGFVGLMAWCRRPTARFFGVVALGVLGLLLLMNFRATHFLIGLLAPSHTLDHHRALILVAIGLAALAGVGMDELLRPQETSARRAPIFWLGITVVVAFCLVMLMLSLCFGMTFWKAQVQDLQKHRCLMGYLFFLLGKFGSPLFAPQISASLKFLIASGVLALIWSKLPPRSQTVVPFVALACAGLLAGDLLYFGMQYNPFVPPSLVYPPTAISDFLMERQCLDRISGVDTARRDPRHVLRVWKGDCFPPSTALPYRLYDVRGKDGFYPERTREFMERIKRDPFVVFEASVHFDRWNSKLLNLLGMRYIISRNELEGPALRCVYKGVPRVYENTAALPRVFVVHKARVIDGKMAMDYILFHEKFDPATEVLLEEEPYGFPLESQARPGSSAHITQYSPNRVVVDVEMTAPGFLVLTDTWAPGWEALVDGVRARLLTANYLVRCVPLPEGRHRIEFRYRPLPFRIGACMTLLTLLSMPLVFVAVRRSECKPGIQACAASAAF